MKISGGKIIGYTIHNMGTRTINKHQAEKMAKKWRGFLDVRVVALVQETKAKRKGCRS